MNKRKLGAIIGFLLLSFAAFSQDANQPEMADVLRSNGKIYTVVAVLGIVITGMFVYLFLTERKLSKLEKQVKEKGL
jgi:CcmD family protein